MKNGQAAKDSLDEAIASLDRSLALAKTTKPTKPEKPHLPKKRQPPVFNEEQLRAIHYTLFRIAWQTNVLYEERQEAQKILDAYFKDDDAHLIRR